MTTFNNFINSEWVAGVASVPNVNPSDTSDVIGHYAQADETQMDATGPALGQVSGKPA